MKQIFSFIAILILASASSFSQDKPEHTGKYIESKNEYWDSIKESVEKFEAKKEDESLKLIVDFEGMDLPTEKESYKYYWHNEPISQGWTGTCWCFAGTSFLESEVKRVNGKELKLSEMFTVYHEYIERAKRFVAERGNSLVAEGSQSNAVLRMWKKYGCVPQDAYSGKLEGQEHHGHKKMYNEIMSYLNEVKRTNAWNEEIVVATVKNILNYHMGEPPTHVTVNGKKLTPIEYRDKVVNLKLDEYVDILSLLKENYWTKAIYPAEDNWWKDDNYYNVPLDNFMPALKSAIKSGYTMMIGGDVSEPGYYSYAEVAIVPDFDIPSAYINDWARQFRFDNRSTTDDHAIHLVGWKEHNGEDWFLIKDSGSGARNGKNVGYYFYHEDYVKLKMMNFMVHKSAVKDLLDTFSQRAEK